MKSTPTVVTLFILQGVLLASVIMLSIAALFFGGVDFLMGGVTPDADGVDYVSLLIIYPWMTIIAVTIASWTLYHFSKFTLAILICTCGFGMFIPLIRPFFNLLFEGLTAL